ncbi:S-adenosyl-L-methionine-dependent methyltransferase [Paraphoma chrysanthemicola]|nr:S-adenosyl-L-methionine-dependent methyltransferase [Paraphoma chrysanthemicola]
MPPANTLSTWSDASPVYKSTVGAVSANAAHELVSMATTLQPFASSSRILDAGCGLGAVTLAVLSQDSDTAIEAIDTSQTMLDGLMANFTKTGLSAPNLNSKIVDINELLSSYGPNSSFTHIFTSFALHVATTDFAGRVQDIHTLLPRGGIFALATFTPHSDVYLIWDRVCRIYDPDYQQASYALDPRAWSTPGQVAAGLAKAGFSEIRSVIRRAKFPVQGADAWVEFWFHGKNPAEEKVVRPFFEKHGDVSVEDVKETYRRVVRDEWDDGRGVVVEFVLAVGKKG